MIGGNHDTPRLRSSGSVFSLMHLVAPRIDFVGGYETKIIPFPELDLTVTAIPHGRLTEPIPPAAFPNPATRNVLVTHGFVPGMEPMSHKEPGEEEVDETLLPARFRLHRPGALSHPQPTTGERLVCRIDRALRIR